jgi:hypothetical protein
MNSEEEISKSAERIRAAILKEGFADYVFIGVDLNGNRVNVYSIGEGDSKENGQSNCQRWDRVVGAMYRQIMEWEIEQNIKLHVDEDHEI